MTQTKEVKTWKNFEGAKFEIINNRKTILIGLITVR
jgi:hypothetical protein